MTVHTNTARNVWIISWRQSMRRLSLPIVLLAAIVALAAGSGSLAAAQQASCPGTPPTQFVIGQRGTVLPSTQGSAVPVRVRQQPNKTGSVLTQLREGETFTISGGPQSADGYLWWQIKTDNGVTGWAAARESTGCFIDPIGTNNGSGNTSAAWGGTPTMPPTLS